MPLAWKSFATPTALDASTFGYRWNHQVVEIKDSQVGSLVRLPEYYRLVSNAHKKAEWIPVRAKDVPAETGLAQASFARSRKRRSEPYVTPDDP